MLFIEMSFAQGRLQELSQEETESFTSIRHEQQDFYQQYQQQDEQSLDSIHFTQLNHFKCGITPKSARAPHCTLTKQVYGYHPHWFGSSYYKNYDYTLLSTFAYFSYELNPTTGGYKNIHGWKTTPAIDLAKQAGCKVELSVTNFGYKNNARFLSNRKAWDRFATTIIELLNIRDADGINIDFEHVPRKSSEALTNFIAYLHTRLQAVRPGSTITMAVPALNSYQIFDIPALSVYVHSFIIMGYDYHYSRSKHAGAVSPLDGYLSIRSTLNQYLNTGVDPSKLILAVPYYGREWRTKSTGVPSNTMSYLKAPTYAQINARYIKKYKSKWDSRSSTPYLVKGYSGNTRQCWYDNKTSLAEKYDLALAKDIGGVGMWALGYDNGYIDLWELIEEKFVDCGATNYPAPFEVGRYPEVKSNKKSLYGKIFEEVQRIFE